LHRAKNAKFFLLFIEPKYSGDRSNELLELFGAALAINDSDQFLTNVLCELLSASLAKSSWDKYCSGWRAWLDFELTQDNCVKWPVDIQTFRKFAAWCIAHRNISHRTTMSYLYSVSIAHSLKGMSCVNYHDDKILKLMMSGAKNTYSNHSVICNNRRVANTYTLKLISHELATSNWCDISKQTVWACCTMAFFASVRLGEILSDFLEKFDPTATLLWKNVKFVNDDEILLFIPCTKTKRYSGEFVDVFAINNMCCPVKALYKLMQIQIELGFFNLDKPVFAFSSRCFLTTRKLNDILKSLLARYYNETTGVISCHSFRGAMINIMQQNSPLFNVSEYQTYGRWASSAYLMYLRNHRTERRRLFDKISNVI
jgi:hypothetical protein